MFFKKKTVQTPVTDERLNSVAIIMDGNGRWAKRRALTRSAGHVAGAANIKNVLRLARDFDIHYLTLYAFSTENWKRPKEEVDGIMKLAVQYLDSAIDEMKKNDQICFRFVGDTSVLSDEIQERIALVRSMDHGQPFVCNVALNYGGRDEILHAANEAVKDGITHITAQDIDERLYTAGTPHPDLLIRTGGEMRVSNFLLWQIAYTELYVTKTLWPDFGRKEFLGAIDAFYGRDRRFGGL
ncbi:MAG: di-trans,poly-cis-decaprenylcistransferase [Clostridia bacterium]|nr:di-trans,poly-cis-decaprenylcistransferase [Clostridia bacterium]